MHQHKPGPGSCNHVTHSGIVLQSADVVDEYRAPVNRPFSDSGLVGIDRQRNRRPFSDNLKYRLQSTNFLLFVNRLRPGSRRLGTDINQINPFTHHLFNMRQGTLRVEKTPAVGKGIRRHV